MEMMNNFNSFNPSPLAADTFRQTFDTHQYQPLEPLKPIEISPIGSAGSSHFGHCNEQCVNPGWHVTTQIPGFGKAEGLDNGLRHHDFIQ